MKSPESIPEFTPRAQQVFALARKEAERLHCTYAGTEHLLLGLLALGQGVAINVFRNLGLNPDDIRAEMERQLGLGPEVKMVGTIPYTPRVKKVIACAAKEALELNHTHVGTEHLLLGLLREGEGAAARVLSGFDVNLEKSRQLVLRELDPLGIHSAPRFEQARPSPSEAQKDRSGLPRDRFTPRVRRTFTLALDEAMRRQQPRVETEHVLLGLVRMGQGVAASVLLKIGVNADTVATHFGAPTKTPASPEAELSPFGPLVREVLKFAAEEAAALEHTYIGTEHILLGLLRQPEGGAARIFQKLYIDPDSLRRQVLLAFEVKHAAGNAGSPAGQPLSPSEKDTEMFAKKASPEENSLPIPAARDTREAIDLTQRYDVYCVERNDKLVVHRNVRFLSVKSLIPQSESDGTGDFVELEQPDGQTVFIAKSTIVRFCAAGGKLDLGNP
jgi:ATP-dependent Clp protease ATP-binding subunit ClpA